MKKTRIVSFLLVFALLFAILEKSESRAAGNPYPLWNDSAHTERSCTSVAWQKVYDTLGIELPSTLGNGGTWYDRAQNSGYSVGNTPQKDSLVVWTGGRGHVAYVLDVDTKNNGIYVYEGGNKISYGSPGIGSRWIYNGNEGTGKPLRGYIYLKKSPEPVNVGVQFVNWGGKRSIGKTNAVLDMKLYGINTSFTNIKKVGMVLYDSNKKKLASAEDTKIDYSTVDHIEVWYDVNKELKYTLSQGTTYYYRFYGVINGKTYYDEYKSFTTSGTPVVKKEVAKPVITLDKTSYIIGETMKASWVASPSGSPFLHYWLVLDNKTTGERLHGSSVGKDRDPSVNTWSYDFKKAGQYKLDVYANTTNKDQAGSKSATITFWVYEKASPSPTPVSTIAPTPTVTPTVAPTIKPSSTPKATPTIKPTPTATATGSPKPTSSPGVPGETYSISYVLNGGENDSSNPSSYTTSKYYNDKESLKAAKREGYSFEGWFDNPSFTGFPKSYINLYSSSGDITLYAKWDKIKVGNAANRVYAWVVKKNKVVIETSCDLDFSGYIINVVKGTKNSSSGKKKTVSAKKKNKYKLSGFKKGNKYTVWAKGYVVDSTGKKIYGSWKKVETLKF